MEKKDIRVRVAGILYDEDGKILFIKHRKNNQEYWLLPGGGLEYGETFQECLKREFREETSIDIKVERMAFVSESIAPDLKRHIVNVYFLITKLEGKIKIGEEENLIDLKFLSKEEIEKNIIYPNIKEELIKFSKNNNCIEYLGNRWE